MRPAPQPPAACGSGVTGLGGTWRTLPTRPAHSVVTLAVVTLAWPWPSALGLGRADHGGAGLAAPTWEPGGGTSGRAVSHGGLRGLVSGTWGQRGHHPIGALREPQPPVTAGDRERLAVLVHGVHGRLAHRHLLQPLSGRRRDVVPAVACKGTWDSDGPGAREHAAASVPTPAGPHTCAGAWCELSSTQS